MGAGITLALVALATPKYAAAASFRELVDTTVVRIGDSIVNLLITLIFLYFLYGIYKFFFLGGGENRAKGKKFVLSGLIGITVLFSVWGIVRVLINTVITPGL